MVRPGSSQLVAAMAYSFDSRWLADLYYDGERRLQDVPIASPRFREDASAKVQHTGSCTVVWSDEFAASVAPSEVSDAMAPFGAQLSVFVQITVGPFTERVEFGRFEITDVPSARDEWFRFRGEWLTAGSTVELELKDLTAGVAEETFDVPTSPSQLTSTWAEVAVLTGLPTVRSVADAPIARTVLYPDKKLDAVYELMSVALDAVPHLTANGSLSARPNVWGPPVARITPASGLIDVVPGLSQSGVRNRVVVRSSNSEDVLAVAEITSGPLRVRNPDGSVSPFRARTRFVETELVADQQQAQLVANSELARVSEIRSRVVDVTEVFNPLRERGDVVDIERPTKTLRGRVVTIDRDGPTQRLQVEVASSTPTVFVGRPSWPTV